MKIRTLIVDDEPHAREGIRIRLKEYPEIEIVGECSSGKEAVSSIHALQPDLLFLDVQMPEMNGFEVLRKISHATMPIIIFVTAYDQYAIQAFECHALDYLLKPTNEKRFREALRRALTETNHRNLEIYAGKLTSAVNDYLLNVKDDSRAQRTREQRNQNPRLNRLMIKAKGQVSMITVDEIDWIESAGDYVYVHSKSHKHLVRETLTNLEEKLDPQRFIRIHRSAIVNCGMIKTLHPTEHGDYDVVLQNGDRLKMSRTFRAHFERVTGNSL